MTRALVLRPEPGNAQTCTRLMAAGIEPVGAPLFEIRACAWDAPDPSGFDALLLTSANGARHAGAALTRFATLPVIAVGDTTAAVARDAGLQVMAVGSGDAAAAVAAHGGGLRLLHLAGRHHVALAGVTTVAVYRSVALPLAREALASADGGVALLHSPRAARRFAAAVDADGRARIAVAALSPAIAAAAGVGWRSVGAAAAPRDALLVALVAEMIDRPRAGVDKLRS